MYTVINAFSDQEYFQLFLEKVKTQLQQKNIVFQNFQLFLETILVVARNISRFVFHNKARTFTRLSQQELGNISKLFTCARSWVPISCGAQNCLFKLIQNKNLEIFLAVPRNINLENFRSICTICSLQHYQEIIEAFVTVLKPPSADLVELLGAPLHHVIVGEYLLTWQSSLKHLFTAWLLESNSLPGRAPWSTSSPRGCWRAPPSRKSCQSCTKVSLKGQFQERFFYPYGYKYTLYTVRKEIKCNGESEIINEYVHYTTRISS